jgi:pimeloyl-ACP methyl ester carboxylesterase
VTRTDTAAPVRIAARAFAIALLCWLSLAAGSAHEVAAPFPPDTSKGRLIVLPGIHNTLFHLNGFVQMARFGLPEFDIDMRRWGTPFFGVLNLRASERNRSVAHQIATDIAMWRREHPDDNLYLMGYSGGGGVVSLVLEALPDDVWIDRLVLVAPAISHEFEIQRHADAHVREFVVNYASERDKQVGLGTRYFGTIDRRYEYAAGYDGFPGVFAGLAQWHWRAADRAFGHRGNHIAYLGRRWQRSFLLPAIDPRMTRDSLEALWRTRRAQVHAVRAGSDD